MKEVKTLRGDFGYRLYWKGEDTTSKRCVGLMFKCELAKSAMNVIKQISLRILSVNLVLCGKVVAIISVYEPKSGQSEEDKKRFNDDLSAKMLSKNGNCIVLNGHVESSINEYEEFHGGAGMGNQK